MRYEETLVHLLLLITIILIGLSVTSCVNWTPVEYIDTPIKEPPLTKVVLEQKAIDKFNSDFDCFIGSSSDECVDFEPAEGLLDPDPLICWTTMTPAGCIPGAPVCNMDLCS